MAKSKAHPGFKAVQKKIAAKYWMKRAGAILAGPDARRLGCGQAEEPAAETG